MKSLFAFSSQGESHKRRENETENLKAGRKFPCQDKSCAETLTTADKIIFDFICVCDGHGGEPYFRSEKGAKYAIEVLKDILLRNMKRISVLAMQKEFEKIKNQLALSITKRWTEKVLRDLTESPITENEFSNLERSNLKAAEDYKIGKNLTSIYGCTLISFFKTESFWFALQIGDGDFTISYDGKHFDFPMPEDENCFLNETTSLCDSDAVKEFRFCAEYKIPKCVFCSSDGVSNSFKTENQFVKFYSSVYDLFSWTEYSKCKKLQCETPQFCNPLCKETLALNEIQNYLPFLSKKGSGDDVSLAGIADIDEKIIQSIKDYNRGFLLYKNSCNGQKSKGKSLLIFSAKNGNSKAWFRCGEICYAEYEEEKLLAEKISKLEKAEKCFAQAKKLGIVEAEVKINQIKDILSKISTETSSSDIKIPNQTADFFKSMKMNIDERFGKIEDQVSKKIIELSENAVQ